MEKRTKTQNDLAWELLFDKYDILSHIESNGKFVISSSAIKEYREPRLMTKFDHSINLPKIFTQNGLSILPISRKEYIIAKFNTYSPFEKIDASITYTPFPNNLQSLNPENIYSESVAINCALASGILSDFLEEEVLYATVSGRMSTGKFDFNIDVSPGSSFTTISVNNSQMEIDAAFEGMNSLSIIEAKRDLSEDFLVRQLYYPFRAWTGKLTKKIRPIFLIYSNGIFSLYEYEFHDQCSYNSISLLKQKNYTFEDTSIEIGELQHISQNIKYVDEPKIPFPQANNFNRVINICELLKSQELNQEQITERYAFNIRQTNYYTDAARYLGLLYKLYDDNHKPSYALTPYGQQIMRLGYRQRQLEFCKSILSHKIFNDTFQLYLNNGRVPCTETIVELMEKSHLYKIESTSTYVRRSSTIIGWIDWILSLL